MPFLVDTVAHGFLSALMPGVAAALRDEKRLSASQGLQADSPAIEIEDNGADTTIIAFAGMAVLFAGMPKFEFRRMLQEGGALYNYISVRDVHRSSYRLAPDGSRDGLRYYERAVADALSRVESRCNIAIGMSGGAEVAFRVSGVAPIHRLIAFNPTLPLERHGSLQALARVLLDVRRLATDPATYLETFFISLGIRYLARRNRRLFGHEDPDLALREYLRAAVPATVFYSRWCWPDARQALELRHVPSITLCPIVSPHHNCLHELKRQGLAAAFIRKQIERQRAACLSEMKTDSDAGD